MPENDSVTNVSIIDTKTQLVARMVTQMLPGATVIASERPITGETVIVACKIGTQIVQIEYAAILDSEQIARMFAHAAFIAYEQEMEKLQYAVRK